MRTQAKTNGTADLAKWLAWPSAEGEAPTGNKALAERLTAMLADIRACQMEQAETLASLERSLRAMRRQK